MGQEAAVGQSWKVERVVIIMMTTATSATARFQSVRKVREVCCLHEFMSSSGTPVTQVL